VTWLGWGLPSIVVAVAEEDAIFTQSCCKGRHYGCHIMTEVGLSSEALDNHAEGSGANCGVQDITDHKVSVPSWSPHSPATHRLCGFHWILYGQSDLNSLRRLV
jgi:hypothetical protein